MLECNQPNHAYDHDVVSGVRVRRAAPGEHLTTLDGAERTLHPDDLLICNQDDVPVGLAGVMGGEHSEVRSTTERVLLEVAWFEPDVVRFAANRHGLRSEASARFERGVDPDGALAAMGRFLTLLSETCPSLRLEGPARIVRTPSCPTPRRIRLRGRTVERILGRAVSRTEAGSLLEPIGFAVADTDDGEAADCMVTVPTWRPDCTEEVDLIEEIARHLGYDTLGKRLLHTTQSGRLSESQHRRRVARSALVGLGLDEVMPSPFLAPGDLARCGLDEDGALRLANPLASEESVLRTSLRPGMLLSASHNVAHRVERVRLWEMGRVWPSGSGSLPDEFEQLGILVVGAGIDDMLDHWLVLADALAVGAQVDQARVPAGLHPGRSASLSRGRAIIGAIGEIDPLVAQRHGIKDRAGWLELDMSVVLGESPKIVRAKSVSRLPSADIDLSFEVPDEVPASEVQRALRQGAGALAAGVVLFDVFRDAAGTRALAFRLRLQPSDRTLTDGDISAVRTACIAAAERTGVRLRGHVD
jgi:phenylalanyl-tRNA synthetase beta chain